MGFLIEGIMMRTNDEVIEFLLGNINKSTKEVEMLLAEQNIDEVLRVVSKVGAYSSILSFMFGNDINE
jgi:hypothetical protein